MASLNQKAVNRKRTHEGAMAAPTNAEQELRRSVMACLLWEDGFYESGIEVGARITALAHQCKPSFVGNLAIEARQIHYLRHVPLLLVCALAGHPIKSRYAHVITDVIQRPDELTELVSMYWKLRGGKRPLPAQMKKGLAKAFTKFDAYQLAKYNRDNEVKLRDVMFMVHPKPKDEKQAITFSLLAENRLTAPDTWEVALSGGADKAETFTRLLQDKKLGYMALLRNLRNMREAGVSRSLIQQRLLEGAPRSKTLPFRFISAARAVPQYEPFLDQAMQLSTDELPKLKGKTLLLLDHSGSMNFPLSRKSDLSRRDAAAGLAILLAGICEELEAFSFSGSFYGMQHGRNLIAPVPHRKGMAMADAYAKSMPNWGGTQLGKALQITDDGNYDRLIVLTDEQSHDHVPNPKGRGYMINVATNRYGVGYKPWIHIDGFSEAIVKWIQAYESESIDD